MIKTTAATVGVLTDGEKIGYVSSPELMYMYRVSS